MTFQIAMIGCDGLLVASDRQAAYEGTASAGDPGIVQTIKQKKYILSPSNSLICFVAGGTTAPLVAQRIAITKDTAKMPPEAQWRRDLCMCAGEVQMPYLSPPKDEILVIRLDTPDVIWLVTRRRLRASDPPVIWTTTIGEHFCTGNNAVAQFLPRHLWKPNLPISDLKTLALLTLSYAAEEDPSSVSAPFDIMTLSRTGEVGWSVCNDPIHAPFQTELENIFAAMRPGM